ncbi:hypothetical protein DYB36_009727 [Aphanomyces astaci]|uniref:Uncharacterized protein n=1 Tax=Aphanomyces astaci TaxID=112090 RepID=A0A397AAW3_APHAT|nr:hypothetical protein DYB36_009727 [Aphanomyces astaci]
MPTSRPLSTTWYWITPAGNSSTLSSAALKLALRNPNQSDYQVNHVHVAATFHNRASKAYIIKIWDIIEGNGYYLVPGNRDLPYQGWKDHHTKEVSTVSTEKKDLILFDEGELPKDQGQGVKRKETVLRSESEKKMKTDDVIIDMGRMIEEGKTEEVFAMYPRNYMIYGERIKGMKNLENRFWDLYDEEVNTHVMLEDLDTLVLDRLGIQFIKTICDEAGFAIDQKYKASNLT